MARQKVAQPGTCSEQYNQGFQWPSTMLNEAGYLTQAVFTGWLYHAVKGVEGHIRVGAAVQGANQHWHHLGP